MSQYKLGQIRRSLIRALREEHGLTQARAAELAGIGSKQRWCNIERGNNGFGVCRSTLEKIAFVLPSPVTGVRWLTVMDTAQDGGLTRAGILDPGGTYPLEGRSLVLLQQQNTA